MTEEDFIKVLTSYEEPAIILYITPEGELKMQTSANLDLAKDMLDCAAKFVVKSVEVELSDGNSEFISKSNFH